MDLKLNNLSEFVLTNGYIPVEYIESSGYPNINTGITTNFNPTAIKIDAVIDVISNTIADSTIYNVSGNGGPYFYLKCVNVDDNTTFIASSSRYNSGTDTTVEFEGKTHIIQSRGYLKIDNTEYTLPAANRTLSTAPSLYILSTGDAHTRIYSYKIYRSTSLLRDYIPVISYQEGHFGEACLYDKVNEVFYYSASTGSFTANPSQGLYDIVTSAYVKDCPNISGINLLRSCINLNRVRVNIGNQSGTISELYKYSSYNGFNDNYENQTKPRIIGTFTINDIPYANYEISQLESKIDGITLIPPDESTYNIDNMLENDELACQVLDSEKPNYNPAIAITLADTFGRLLPEPIIENEGRWCLPKNMSAAFGMALRGVTTVTDTNKVVSDNDEVEYDFENFEEFQYFTGFTTITAGSSTSALGAFGGCTKLKKIILPNTITSIGAYAFYNCTALESINIPNTVTSIGGQAFEYCSSLKSLVIPSGVSTSGYAFRNTTNLEYIEFKGNCSPAFGPSGCLTGAGNYKTGSVCIIRGNLSSGKQNGSYVACKMKKFLIYGNCTLSLYGFYAFSSVIRIQGNVVQNGTSANATFFYSGTQPFIEVMGTFSSAGSYINGANTCPVFHVGLTQLIGITPTVFGIGRVTKVYVGDGSSKAADEAVFALYNADTDWTTYCGSGVPGDGKVDLWWNYNGEYKWYYITDNLTNCTNSNPDEWPHITRGESYETTIVADEGMTIDSVTVEMLDTDTTSSTYDTMVDITSSVYDSSTGEINIPSVTGNVVITANAS